MNSATTSIRDVTRCLDRRHEETLSRVNDVFDSLERALKERRDALLGELDAMHAGKRATLEAQLTSCDDVMATVEGSCDFTCDVIERGTDTEVRSNQSL